MGPVDAPTRWNHNIHYHGVVLDAIPPHARTALEVGCGEGMLARQLRERVPGVTAIDLDAPSIELARRQDPRGEIHYLRDDFLTHDFTPESFDLVASVAALHHMPASTALARMAALLRPGGRLAVVGLARARLPADLPHELAAVLAQRFHQVTKAYWEHSAPTVWPPPETYRGMRRISARALPGARYRRHLLWRYSLVWTKPRRA